MPTLRRLPSLAIAALLLAACGAPDVPSPTGAATAMPRPSSPAPTVEPSPTMALAACPKLDADYLAPSGGLTMGVGMGGGGSLITTRVSRADGTSMLPEHEAPSNEAGIVPGGVDVPIEVWVYYQGESQELGLTDSVELRSIDARLTPDGLAPVPLVVEAAPGAPGAWTLTFAPLPDDDGAARFDIDLTWRDRCFDYAGTASVDVVYRSTATLAACPREDGTGWTYLQALLDGSFRFGTTEVDLGPSAATTIYAGTPIEDGAYPLSMFDRDAAAHVAAPGGAITFGATNPDLLLSLSAVSRVNYYRRAGAIRHIDEGGATQGAFQPSVVAYSTITRLADGRFRVNAPPEAGRYVAGVRLPYESDCSVGFASAGVGLDVVVPN